MIIQTFGSNIPIVVFRDILKQQHVSLMLKEIRQIKKNHNFLSPLETASAVSELNETKSNKSVFIEEMYSEAELQQSPIFGAHVSVVNPIIQRELKNKHPKLEYFFHTNWRSTLLNIYSDKDKYFSHFDVSVISSITTLWNTPKKFSGGDLFFEEYNITIQPDLGDVIIFPGHVFHEVKEVQTQDLENGERYSITQFFKIV